MVSSTCCFGCGVLFAIVGFCAGLATIGLQWWTYSETEFFGSMLYLNKGLWKWCQRTEPRYGEESFTCGELTEPEDYESSVRTLLSLSLMLLGVGFVASCAHNCFLKGFPMLGIAGAAVIAFSGFMSWLAVVMFAGEYPKVPGNQPSDVHAGWGLAFCMSVLTLLAVPMMLIEKLRGKTQVYTEDRGRESPDGWGKE